MSKDIVVEFSGWIRLRPENIRFEYIGQGDMPQNCNFLPISRCPFVIDGVQWQALSEDEQGDYILEDAVAAIRDSDDGEWVDLSVEVHQPV